MKNLLVVLGFAVLLSGCGPDYKAEVDRMMRERDSLMAQYDAKDSVINGYMTDISEIQQSIEGLAQQEELLSRTASNPEATPDTKARILNDVEAIRQLIDQNKKKLSDLQARVRRNNVKLAEFEKMIKSLNMQLAEKDSSINVLNENVLALNGTITNMQGTIDTLSSDNAAKLAEINDKTTRLHTAYYTVGTFKELRDKKVLTKEGGFLGIGKQKTVLPDFNRDAFTQIDLTSTKTININKKDAKLLSTHPSGSYKLQRDANQQVTAVEITDPETFWKASKYLVVVTD
jgi:predicted  nucleic acid-binding Zn-ribbon protein